MISLACFIVKILSLYNQKTFIHDTTYENVLVNWTWNVKSVMNKLENDTRCD